MTAIPDFPLKSEVTTTNKSKTESNSKTEPLPSYVQDYLPPFPDSHSWKQTPVCYPILVIDD